MPNSLISYRSGEFYVWCISGLRRLRSAHRTTDRLHMTYRKALHAENINKATRQSVKCAHARTFQRCIIIVNYALKRRLRAFRSLDCPTCLRFICSAFSLAISRNSFGSIIARSSATGSPRWRPRIMTAQRMSLERVCIAPQREKFACKMTITDEIHGRVTQRMLTVGIPKLRPTVAYADTISKTRK